MPRQFRRNILAGFGVSLAALLISSVASYISIRNLLESSRLVDHTHNVLWELERVRKDLYRAESHQRGYLISGDTYYLDSLQSIRAALQASLADIRKNTADNIVQIALHGELELVVQERLNVLREVLREKEEGEPLSNKLLARGQVLMENSQDIIDRMEDVEQQLMRERVERMSRYSTFTPILIVFAALVALVITSVFYRRIINDYRHRLELQEELQRKDEDLVQRIAIIREIAERISKGDYSVRVDDREKDVLGTLGGSLNKMADSLESSFRELSEREWLRSGMAELNAEILGEQELEQIASRVLRFVADYTQSHLGALYYLEEPEQMLCIASYGFQESGGSLGPGEFVRGAIENARPAYLEMISGDQYRMGTLTGEGRFRGAMAIPLLLDGKVIGAIELASLHGYGPAARQFVESVSERSAIALNTETNRKRLRELLQKTQAQAEELARTSRYKSEFLANMSHELRTPLNSILLLSRLMAENPAVLSEERMEYARLIQRSGQSLLSLIDELLDLAQIEAGRMDLRPEFVSLQEIVDDVAGIFEPLAAEKGLDFQIKQEENLPERMLTDRMRIAQILRNLMGNAIKFTAEGSVAMHISIRDRGIRFAVRDTGIGIPPEKQELVFEAFRQADGSTQREFGGTGLGLSISRELARLLGGEILLESEPGKGSEFRLILPLQTPPFPGEEPEQSQARVSQGGERGAPADESMLEFLQGRKVLVADDDVRNIYSISRALEAHGVEVVPAIDGNEALRRLEEEGSVDMVLLDMMMPEMDGYETMRRIRSDPRHRGLPIIAVTAMSKTGDREKCIREGATDYISKPVDQDRLIAVLRAWLYAS